MPKEEFKSLDKTRDKSLDKTRDKSLDKTRDKQPKTERARPEEFGRGSLEAQVEGPVFATEEELAEKEKLLQALKQVEPDKSIEGLEKQKEILIKMNNLDERRKQRIARERGEISGETVIKAINPEKKEIEINLEQERQYWQEFYNNHNFKDKIEIPEIKLNPEQIEELQTLIEQGFIDKCAVIPDNLTYQELLPEMTKGYEETWIDNNFDNDGGFNQLDKQETSKQPNYRIIFYKKAQNLEDDKILKEAIGKSPEPGKLDDSMSTYLREKNQELQTNIEGISLKDYLIIQREFAETINTDKDIQDKSRHMDKSSWSWCLKSRFKNSGRVVYALWDPDNRRLEVYIFVPSGSYSSYGPRFSRSFVLEK